MTQSLADPQLLKQMGFEVNLMTTDDANSIGDLPPSLLHKASVKDVISSQRSLLIHAANQINSLNAQLEQTEQAYKSLKVNYDQLAQESSYERERSQSQQQS
jgi:predicted  nucleic acid-binding Zn-ribbon protein